MKKLLLPLLFFALAEFVVRSPANCEPTPSVRWLMDEPASLFDLGMIRMRMSNDKEWAPKLMARIKELKLGDEISLKGAYVVYDLDNNIIHIEVVLVGKPNESLCTDILREYKEVICPYRKLGAREENKSFVEIVLAIDFNHVNYERGNKPKDLNKNIVQIMEFTVGIGEPDTAEWYGEKIYCKSKFFDNTPTFNKFQRQKK